MKIGIIDAEIVGKTKHRFPNLACMKISNYYKSLGNDVELMLDYDNISNYDKVFISKVFVKTTIPFEENNNMIKNELTVIEFYKDNPILNLPNVECGGTGFYYDESPKLPYEIEHFMPDYHLYDEWVEQCVSNGAKEKEFTYYRDYSIGFLTRGCFRQCEFCVNKHYKKCEQHSPIQEFYDNQRKKLCFLDDNFFACSEWKGIIQEVKSINKKFQFKQGLDERLLTEEKVHELISWKYDGDYIFAFDNIEDKELIISKLEMIYKLYPNFKKRMKFYIFCGYDRNGIYDEEFWKNDISEVFERCFILAKYSAIPYIMRHENFESSPYKGMYIDLSSWANQPSFFKKMSFRIFCMARGMSNENYKKYKLDFDKYLKEVGKKGSCWRYMENFERDCPQIAGKYYDIVADSLLEHGNGRKVGGANV